MHDLHLQDHGVDPRHLFIDFFRTSSPKKHRYRHLSIVRIILAMNTKNNEYSALGPFYFCAAGGQAT